VTESSQKVAEAVEHLAHLALVGFPEDCVQRMAAYAFVDGVMDLEVKHHLLMDREISLNKVLKLEAAKVAAGPRSAHGNTVARDQLPQPYAGSEGTVISEETVDREGRRKQTKASVTKGSPVSSSPSPRFILNNTKISSQISCRGFTVVIFYFDQK
jgi:hypothetical protein